MRFRHRQNLYPFLSLCTLHSLDGLAAWRRSLHTLSRFAPALRPRRVEAIPAVPILFAESRVAADVTIALHFAPQGQLSS